MPAKQEAGCTRKEIAGYLHVHPSTITREIQRNGYSRYRCYRPRIAQERAAHRWRCRHLPRRFKEDVRKKVDEMILMDYSPEQIIGILECLKQYDLVKTITADNGLQFAEHERVSRATSVGFFFARPYHSWGGRGTASYLQIRCSASQLGWTQECLCKPQLMLLTA